MIVLVLVTLFPSYVKTDVQVTQEFVEPIKNWSFEEIDSSVCEARDWTTNNGGWRELRSDVNEDGTVNVLDTILVLINQGPVPPRPPECDLNGDGTVNSLDLIIVQLDSGKTMGVHAFKLDGGHSWYTSGGGDYKMWQSLDTDVVDAVKDRNVTFSFWFLPESFAPDGSQNYARAEIHYYWRVDSSHGDSEVFGNWRYPTETEWINALVTAYIPAYAYAIIVRIHGTSDGTPDFKAWIDCAQFTVPSDTTTLYSYSTDYEFVVPDDGDAQVFYHHTIEVYVGNEWSWRDFWFLANPVNDWVLNVRINGKLKYYGSTSDPECQPVSVDLGLLTAGYHTLEFDFVEQLGYGGVKFCVALDGDPNLGKAALTKFRVGVPNYSEDEVKYTVKTTTYFPGDDFFLGGYADDYIDDVWVDASLKWQDWMWDMGPTYGAIYAWGDGFMYPLPTWEPWHTITFTYGEIEGAGRLDFEYISWSNQRDRIGNPRFYASANIMNLGSHVTLNEGKIYGGSRWESPEDPGISERTYETRTTYNVSYDDGSTWFDACLEVGAGNWWAEWGLTKGSHDDVGIPLNFTVVDFDSNLLTGLVGYYNYYAWEIYLKDYTIDAYSFPNLRITGMEADTGDSKGIIDPGYVIAMDFGGTAMMFISSTFAEGPAGIIGATVGLGIKGIAAVLNYIQGQEVSRYDQTIQEDHHWQLESTRNMWVDPDEPRSASDLVFLGLDPTAGKHCGLTKVVLKGTLQASYWMIYLPTGYTTHQDYPIGNIEITLNIPWFIWP